MKKLKYEVPKEHSNSELKDERIKMHNGGGWKDGTISTVLAHSTSMRARIQLAGTHGKSLAWG